MSDRDRLQAIRDKVAQHGGLVIAMPHVRPMYDDMVQLFTEVERLEKVNDNLIAENKRLEAGYCGDRKYASVQDALTETELLRQGLEDERDEMCAALHGRAEYGHKCKERGLTDMRKPAGGAE